MRFFDYITTAFRNLTRQKARTILTIVSIIIGAMVVILIVSLATNAKKVFRAQLESMGGLSIVTVTPSATILDNNQNLFGGDGGECKDECKRLDDNTIVALKKINSVADVSPVIVASFGKMNMGPGTKKGWANFTGLEAGSKVINIPIVAGRAIEKGDIGKVVIGMDNLRRWGYAEKPNEMIGKNVIVQTQGWYTGWGVDIPRPPENGGSKDYWEELQSRIIELKFEVIGVTSSAATDNQNFISIEFARELSKEKRWEWDKTEQERRERERVDQSNLPTPMYLKVTDRSKENGYGSIMIKADEPENVEAIAKEVEKLGYGTLTSKDALADLMEMLTGLSIILSIIGGIALVVAGIGIINTMVMSMYERTYEIGVMRACGATRATIRRLFTFEAALIGFWGGVFGLIVCYGLAKIANHYIAIYLPKMGVTADIALTFPLWLILGTLAFTTLIGMLAGVYPAFRAAKLDPVEALRYE